MGDKTKVHLFNYATNKNHRLKFILYIKKIVHVVKMSKANKNYKYILKVV